MILREDYKSRDEVEGLIFFPKYHFNPQETRNIPCNMFPTTKSPSVILYGSPLPFPASAELVEIFSQFFFPQRGFSLSCAQCNAYLLYCARNKQPARGQGRSTYMFEAIVGPFPLTQIVALIWVAIRSATQISATIFICMCGDRKVAIISAILIAIRAPLIVRLFENNRDYLK